MDTKYLLKNNHVGVKMPAPLQRLLDVRAPKRHVLVLTPDISLYTHLLLPEISAGYLDIRQPCDCGFFGTSYRNCVCEVEDIEKYRADLHLHFSTHLVYEDPGTPWRNFEFYNLESDVVVLLRSAYKELHFLPSELLTLIEVAEEIRTAGEDSAIRPEHVAEAIAYLKLGRR